MSGQVTGIDAEELKARLRDGEIALLDAREELPFGRRHLLMASCVPLSRLELLVDDLVPRRATRVVWCDDNKGLVAARLPAFAEGQRVRSWSGLYDITPDWNPVLSPHTLCRGPAFDRGLRSRRSVLICKWQRTWHFTAFARSWRRVSHVVHKHDMASRRRRAFFETRDRSFTARVGFDIGCWKRREMPDW